MLPNGMSHNAAGNFFSNLQAGSMSGVVTIRRKKRTSALLHHPKRMFEEAQMARRVKAYLSNLEVIGMNCACQCTHAITCVFMSTCACVWMCSQFSHFIRIWFVLPEDEEKLNEMSIACEGKAKNEVSSSGSMISAMSPTLSGPRLGAEGQNINRLMALSEKSRTVNSKQNTVSFFYQYVWVLFHHISMSFQNVVILSDNWCLCRKSYGFHG